jgi:D-alanine-D-alanine ligase-like ATP-grasp enzyme
MGRDRPQYGVVAMTRVIEALGSARLQPLREFGVALDLVRGMGPRHAWQRFREERERGIARGPNAFDAYREIWGEAAAELEAELRDLSGGFFELRRGEALTRVWQHWVPLDSGVALRLALDKTRVDDLLSERGIRIPAHCEFDFRDLQTANSFLTRRNGPFVVKPSAGTGSGSGVTSGVMTRDDLVRARLRAARIARRILIERQIVGDMYRLLFLDGELLATVLRRVPQVTGDGRATVGELITAENRRRLSSEGPAGMRIITVDLDTLLALRNQDLGLSTVTSAGTTVHVKGVASQNAPEENETVQEPLADELVDEARAAADAVGLRLAGVDVVTSDPSRSLQASGGAIIEVNGTPGLHYHYYVADPDTAIRVAIPILSVLLGGAAKEERQIDAVAGP